MHLILLSRTFTTPAGSTLRVSLLQDTDTLETTWEVRRMTFSIGAWVGTSSRNFATRTEAMRLVRRMFYGTAAVA